MPRKRRIRQNIWGNWYGYLGARRNQEFGTNDVRAGHWLLTGENTIDAYADENYDAARKAAREFQWTIRKS